MNPVPTPPPATTPPMMGAGGAMPTPPQPQMMPQGGMPPAAPTFEGGGETPKAKSNPIKDFFSDINVVEAGILALGVATFLYAIYYYKFEMTLSKTGYADLNARMQKLESAEAKRKAAEAANANATGKMAASRRRILM